MLRVPIRKTDPLINIGGQFFLFLLQIALRRSAAGTFIFDRKGARANGSEQQNTQQPTT